MIHSDNVVDGSLKLHAEIADNFDTTSLDR